VHALNKFVSVCATVVGLSLAVAVPAAAAQKTAKSATSSKASRGAQKSQAPRVVVSQRGRRAVRMQVVRVAPRVEAARPSFGQLYGLHDTADALDLKSSVALVVDQDTNEVLVSKNPQAVLPIASITKLMTALVVTESGLSSDEVLTVTEDDIDMEKGSRSRLKVGTQLTRGEMLHLALMSSENRAAHALGRHYPTGLEGFVAAMNRKARELRMDDTHFNDPTGLSSQNQSSARDLATLVKAAYRHQIIRDLSTSPEYAVAVGDHQLQYRTTNNLVLNPSWEIGLQKTGYISEAGRCLVMQARLAGRKLIMVFLDSAGKYSRLGDAERVRRWLTETVPAAAAAPAAVAARLPKLGS
jgi:serine-type D-Ala-D-Ala endopeptidase (penicillin-binding protein 7)